MSADAAERVLESVTESCYLDHLPTAERIALAQVHALLELASAVRAIAHGGLNGPGGLEALAMAIAGERLESPLSAAISYGLDNVAEAITNAGGDDEESA